MGPAMTFMEGVSRLAEAVQRRLVEHERREQAASGSRPSKKMPGKRKKKKRRKKKVPKSSSSHSSRRDVGMGRRGMHDRAEDEFGKEEAAERADVLTTETVVSDTLHAEPLNSAHSKEVAGEMDEVHKFFGEKVITGDTGEETILKNGQQAMSLYSDRTHMYIQRRCWPDWGKHRRRYVRRLGCAPWKTGLLPTASDGQVCHEERVEQKLSGNLTVKDLIWLLFYVPPDLEFQFGRANAVSGRIHRMLNLGHRSIDNDDEEPVLTKTRDSGGGCQEGEDWIQCRRPNVLYCRIFEALHEFYSSQCRGVRISAGVARICSGLLCQTQGPGERWRRRRESVPGVGPLAN